MNVDDLSDVDFSTDSSESDDADAGDSTGYPGMSSLPTSDTGLHSDSGMGSTFSAHASGAEDKEQALPGPSTSSASSAQGRASGSEEPDQGSTNSSDTPVKQHTLLDQLSRYGALG